MEYRFAKLHGLGNDFIFIEDWDRSIELSSDEVARLCDRHTGIGADGIILVRPSERPECAAYMHYINSDGTLAQMCGNGVRCFAKYLIDRRLVDVSSGSLVADTLAGPKPIAFTLDGEGRMATATVDMGTPTFDPALIPVCTDVCDTTTDDGASCAIAAIASPWGAFSFACVSMGNPHAVCFLESFDGLPDGVFSDSRDKSLDSLDVAKVGAFFESHIAFPEKANIEFVEVAPGKLRMRVFERGCGETLACGTGACAVAVAAALTGRAPRETDVALRGGTLHIAWTDDGHVMMTGPARQSFTGTFALPLA